MCVCLSVKSHASGASVRRKSGATYSVGNEGQNICGVFSENVPLQRLSAPSLDGHTAGRPFLYREQACALWNRKRQGPFNVKLHT